MSNAGCITIYVPSQNSPSASTSPLLPFFFLSLSILVHSRRRRLHGARRRGSISDRGACRDANVRKIAAPGIRLRAINYRRELPIGSDIDASDGVRSARLRVYRRAYHFETVNNTVLSALRRGGDVMVHSREMKRSASQAWRPIR